ncbi:hypothetical protein C8R43DRAFT_187487 [Mycena crocata]|nr:hypothetical protein C8R43DRAFT_187487 [Mycena crocata]
MISLLPPDILLQVVASLSLQDSISLSMANKSLNTLSQEHSFWLSRLRTTHLSSPLPCSTVSDLTLYSAAALKRLALHALRLQRNWQHPVVQPDPNTPIRTLASELPREILFCLAGTDAVVLFEGTLVCYDVRRGICSKPLDVGCSVLDVSAPLEEPEGFTVALLVNRSSFDAGGWEPELLIVTATPDPVSTRISFRRVLDSGYRYSSAFLSASGAVVGVARAGFGGSIEVQTFSACDPTVETTILTDRVRVPAPCVRSVYLVILQPPAHVLGTAVLGRIVFLIDLQARDAVIYACPPRLMASVASTETSADYTDYTLQRSHVARIPRPSPSESNAHYPQTRFDVHVEESRVLSTEPRRGRSTVSVAAGWQTVEVTFWPRPATFTVEEEEQSEFITPNTDLDRERAAARLFRPTRTISVPGALLQPSLISVANSGLAVVLVVRLDVDAGATAGGAAEKRHKLMLVRYDPAQNTASLHELDLRGVAAPVKGTGEEDEAGDGQGNALETSLEQKRLTLDPRHISSLALDDHRGVVILSTIEVQNVQDVLWCVPYA